MQLKIVDSLLEKLFALALAPLEGRLLRGQAVLLVPELLLQALTQSLLVCCCFAIVGLPLGSCPPCSCSSHGHTMLHVLQMVAQECKCGAANRSAGAVLWCACAQLW